MRTSWRGYLCALLCLVAAAGPAAGQGQNQNQGVSQRVDELEARVAALEAAIKPQIVTVECAAGQSVNAALASTVAAPHVTIRVLGVCAEAVRIRRDDVTLVGAAPGSGLAGVDLTQPVLDITASSRVVLSNLGLTGGRTGLRLAAAAAVVGTNIAVSGAAQNGVEVEESVLRLFGSNVSSNGANGILAVGGASVRLFDGSVENNGFDGARVRDTSILGGGRSLKIQGNGGRGVFCDPEPAVAQLVPGGFSITSANVSNNGAEEINCRGVFVP